MNILSISVADCEVNRVGLFMRGINMQENKVSMNS